MAREIYALVRDAEACVQVEVQGGGDADRGGGGVAV